MLSVGQKPPLCSGNSLSQTSSSTSFPCSAYVIVIFPVSIYLIFIDFFFQAELTQSVKSALFEAEGTLLERKVASREPLPLKAICIIVATYEYFGDIDHSPECWDG